ncbi:hypothetical protein LV164_001316 [Aspergillus fumigatus]|uniref:Uncharacterized protein n=1 Tax=Aspergillus fumigatus TaxID=746128 RepID=A0A9P8N9F7_ASPFM|nr:hypothetical protein CNMCM8714_003488 [Aspergillus fumigatus]KAF4266047.1 hypothetical protein CNMCM8812_002899 [Aspergillus fumigatus]KAH1270078.1 hypothetical protein KXX45_002184 [Aspergillus fumigatus]KAH1375699.1 hypothetical protein KXX10_001559 [Aspergillus fumigatus]KAH1401620.1 hypothetical protein KXX22_003211 [Aspergillus fumigatus]
MVLYLAGGHDEECFETASTAHLRPLTSITVLVVMQAVLLLAGIALLASFTPATLASQHVLGLEAASGVNNDMVITGVYKDEKIKHPMIIIHDINGKIVWNWSVSDVGETVPHELLTCIATHRAATEVKFAAKGSKVTAIIGSAALVINYPGKQVLSGICLDGPQLSPAHTVELLPDNLFAIGDSNQNPDAGVWIYDSHKLFPRREHQHLKGIKAVHGMIWDDRMKSLWVSGTTEAADGKGVTAYGIVQRYQYDSGKGIFSVSENYTFPCPSRLFTEWGDSLEGQYWDGPHDIVPIPNQRLLLVPLERDIHAINITSGETYNDGEQLAKDHLKGFRPIGARVGMFGDALPRSDIKSISVRADGSVLYTQAVWKETGQWFAIANQVNLLNVTGDACSFFKGKRIYRSRWFQEIPGWPTA